MENKPLEQNPTPPHAKSLFYRTIGDRNLLVSDLQKILNSTNAASARDSEIIDSIISDVAIIESKILAMQKLFPELLHEEENLRQFSLQKRLQAVKRTESSKDNTQADKETQKKVKPEEIKGESTDLYEDGKVVTKFK